MPVPVQRPSRTAPHGARTVNGDVLLAVVVGRPVTAPPGDRRSLGTGPQTGNVRAAEADLLPGLPGVRLPDGRPPQPRRPRRTPPAGRALPRRSYGVGAGGR
ncbi:hypothetical protein ACE1SV_73750 [Streptomyces sp. E-15]